MISRYRSSSPGIGADPRRKGQEEKRSDQEEKRSGREEKRSDQEEKRSGRTVTAGRERVSDRARAADPTI